VLHDSIAERAYQLFQQRARTDGQDLDDWVQAECELAGGRTYRIAVLIVGSLLWDSSAHRAAWRRERLSDEAVFVHVPIRYGRLSESRANTYTMVFSNELPPDRIGRAVAVLCRRRIASARDLAEEAAALWSAEQPTPRATGAISASWGGVGLLCNPRTDALEKLCSGWTERVRRAQQHYRNFPHAPREAPALDSEGMLTIPWPTAVSGDLHHVDMLLATATRPGPFVDGTYPTPGLIAAAWKKEPREARYFHENRRAGIATTEDEAILKDLEREN
jgi:hypothetical protein